jgi:hypothetical protein
VERGVSSCRKHKNAARGGHCHYRARHDLDGFPCSARVGPRYGERQGISYVLCCRIRGVGGTRPSNDQDSGPGSLKRLLSARNEANNDGSESPNRKAWSDEDDASPSSGATVLVAIGFVVILAVAGVIWLPRNKVPLEPGYDLTNGSHRPVVMRDEATLSRPSDPGVTVGTAPCSIGSRAGTALVLKGYLVHWPLP